MSNISLNLAHSKFPSVVTDAAAQLSRVVTPLKQYCEAFFANLAASLQRLYTRLFPSQKTVQKLDSSIVEVPSPTEVAPKSHGGRAAKWARLALISALAAGMAVTGYKAFGTAIYESYFSAGKKIVEGFSAINQRVLGVLLGSVVLETPALARGFVYGYRYGNTPESYGFNTIRPTHSDQRPVLLFHGAIGTWNYLGDLATAINKTERPVYVMSLGSGEPTAAQCYQVHDTMDRIQQDYVAQFGKSPDGIDFVAHSMGANLAIYSSFDKEQCASIAEGFSPGDQPKANPMVGKVITLANPTDAQELSWLQSIGKSQDIFNVVARYDALMGHKEPALAATPSQFSDSNAGHVGIVFDPIAFSQVTQILAGA